MADQELDETQRRVMNAVLAQRGIAPEPAAAPDPKALMDAIETDARVIALAKSRGQFGTVSTQELRQLGYAVPDNVKFALGSAVGGKNFRGVGACRGRRG